MKNLQVKARFRLIINRKINFILDNGFLECKIKEFLKLFKEIRSFGLFSSNQSSIKWYIKPNHKYFQDLFQFQLLIFLSGSMFYFSFTLSTLEIVEVLVESIDLSIYYFLTQPKRQQRHPIIIQSLYLPTSILISFMICISYLFSQGLQNLDNNIFIQKKFLQRGFFTMPYQRTTIKTSRCG